MSSNIDLVIAQVITNISLKISRIAEKDTLRGFRLKFMRRVRFEERIASTPKNLKRRVARKFMIKKFKRRFVIKRRRW